MPIFHHDAIDFYYEQHGLGLPLVMSHGLTGDVNQITDLLGHVPGYSLIVWDARGHGRTTPLGPDAAFTFGQFARDLAALLDHLDLKSSVVVGGVSMGAGVSVRFALESPELVRALILVRPAWLDQPSPPNLELFVRAGELLAGSDIEASREQFLNSPEYTDFQQADPINAVGWLDQFAKPDAVARSARLRSMPRSCPIQSWDEVKGCRIPTLVIGTVDDSVHPLEYAQEWAARLPKAILAEAPSRTTGEPYRARVRAELARYLGSLS